MKLAKMSLLIPMLAMAPAVAQAGSKCTSPVTVDSTNRWARGALGTARNSSDVTQGLSCTAYSYGYVYCYARDAAGYSVSCGTSDPTYINTLQTLTSDSYIYFAFDSAGTCTSLVVEAMSCLDPKGP